MDSRFTKSMEGVRMVRDRLGDDAWDLIADVFPKPAETGRPRKDPREMVDAILFVLRTGCPWRDLASEFGPWQSAYHWFNTWASDGTLDEILHRLVASHIDVGEIDEELWCVDGTHIRAARCAAGGGKKGSRRSLATTR